MTRGRGLLALALLLGCSDEEQDVQPDPAPAGCPRDEGQLAESRRCLLDEDCPCGAHCALGACSFDCTSAAECGGELLCDDFGRCSAADAPFAVRGASRGELLVDRTLVELLEPGAVATVRVRAAGAPIEATRVSSLFGVEVACGENLFGQNCRLGPAAPGEPPLLVRVRRVGPTPDANLRGEIAIDAPGQRVVVGVRIAAPAPVGEVSRAGVYDGVARLVGAGLRARTVQDQLPDQLQRLELPVRIEVFPLVGAYHPVRLTEVRGAVFPSGTTGRLSLGADRTWTLDVPGRPLLGDPADPRAPAVFVSGRIEEAVFRGGLLDGDYVASLDGIAPEGQQPFLRWRLSAARVDDLPPGAMPPPDEPVSPPDPAARAEDPLPEEQAALRAIAGLDTVLGRDRAVAVMCSGGTLVTQFGTGVDDDLDLSCAGGGRQRLFGREQGTLRSRAEFVASCEAGVRPAATPAVGDGSACVDRTRVIAALAAATEADRVRAFRQGSPDLGASRLAGRLASRWLERLAFLGIEPRRIHRLAVVAPDGPELAALSVYAQADAVLESLRASIAGWDLLLHPRIGAPLVVAPPESLVFPDYRGDFGSAARGGPQEIGLSVAILSTLKTQIEGFDAMLEDLRFLRAPPGRAEALRRELDVFFPRAVAVFALAQGLFDAARSEREPAWSPSWRTARVEYGAALARMLDNLRLLEAGVNPLGIDPEDLPLYRLGDQAGTNVRFSAISDSLLGREDRLDPAIAPVLVEQASGALELARTSIRDLLARELTEAFEQAGAERRLLALNRRYGEQIASLCGRPEYNSLTLLSMAGSIDPDACFLAPGCGFDPEDLEARLTVADVGYQVCLTAKLREAYGDAVSTGQAALDRSIDRVSGGFSPSTSFFSSTTILSVIDGFRSAYQGVSTAPRVSVPGGVDAAVARRAEAECQAARETTLGERPTAIPDRCASAEECPVDFSCRADSSTCEPVRDVADPQCFYGSLGEVAVAMQAAGTDITIARSELEEFSERYDNAMRGCLIRQQNAEVRVRAIEAHNATMDQLGSAKLAADIAANTAEAAKDMFNISNPKTAFGAILFGAVESGARSTSATLEFRMEQTERAHEATLARIEAAGEARACFNDAEAQLVGARTAALRIRRQAQELARQFVEFQNLKISLRALIDEGLASLEAEESLTLTPARVDYWLDQNLELLEQRMRRARRALYLAVLAVEYEYQFSSVERASVLAAQLPADLEAVQGRLRDEVRRGAPRGGGNPTELLTVLSLRRNLMQLADRTGDTERHALTEAERFRRLLVSPRFAVHGEDGRYQGQEIPFTIQPFGRLRLGDPGAIPLLSGLNCAERLWSVNASLLGSDLMVRTDTSIATVQLRKRNTFSSQWCDARTEPESQEASTRPSRNLFVDPLSSQSWAQDRTLADLTDTREVSAFSRATVQARLNVPQSDLEREAFRDGSSTALAGRGVFGDYALFIPATTLSVDGSAGLRLDRVEDVLIRLDYVAAEAR